MKMSKVGNQTNSQDPQAVNSRVFVGNLNTFQCSKTDVERMFQRYGRLAGISMHKGYAFVQFTNPFDARSACLGEDGRTILSQVLDVNMVAEPKPHQTGRKRQNVAKTGNDWDYYYDSYYASTAGFPVGPPPRLVPPLKRPRLMPPPGGRSAKSANNQQKAAAAAAAALAAAVGNPLAAVAATTPAIATCVSELAAAPQASVTTVIDQLKTYSNPDILICGNCREMFTEIKDLIEHKKTYCKLRFTCKCHKLNSNSPGDDGHGTQITDGNTVSLLCVQCKDSFPNAWDLMVHAQAAHMVNIYELGIPKDEKQDTDGSVASSPRAASPEKEEILKNGSLLVNGNEELDAGDCEDNDRQAMLGSPDSRGDKDLEEMMDIESTAQACIMHALSIGSVPNHECKSRSAAVLPGDAPPLVALTNGKQ